MQDCGNVEIFQNSFVEVENSTVGSVASVICNRGFCNTRTASNTSQLTCATFLDDDEVFIDWTPGDVTCESKGTLILVIV